MNPAVVTALFDIGREKYGRPMSDYLSWFKDTLRLNVNMIIYTEEKFVDFIKSIRNENDTKIIIQKLNEIPYYKYNDQINAILNEPSYIQKIKDISRIECNLSLYNVIQYSKFGWIQNSFDNNHFDAEYIFWMDAGCSRFFDGYKGNDWPDLKKLSKTKFLIQGNINTQRYLQNFNPDDYIFENNCILVGTLFGGHKEVFPAIVEGIEQIFTKDMLERKIVNNEQIALALLYYKNSTLFDVYININGQHLPLFSHLKK